MSGQAQALVTPRPTAGPWLRQGDRTLCSSVAQFARLWPGARFSSEAPRFYANALRLHFGGFRIDSSANSSYHCQRDAALIAAHPVSAISIETILEGSVKRHQQGLSYLQKAGSIAITILDEPFDFTWTAEGRSIRTVSDLSVLPAALRRPNAIRAGLVARSPLAASYVGFVQGLLQVAQPEAVDHRTLESSLAALHQNLLLEAMQVSVSPTNLRERIEEHIHGHLADVDLSPTSIAAALFVSVRSVHAAFNTDGITLAAEIRRQRVLAAVRLLQASSNASLDAVAHQCGFRGVDTFRRGFVAVIGTSPSTYRAQLGR